MFLPPSVIETLRLSLEEDLGQGDVLGNALRRYTPQTAEQSVTLAILPREACVVSGLGVIPHVIQLSGLPVRFTPVAVNGQSLMAREAIGHLSGALADVLALERLILNLLQMLCAVATHTARFVKAVEGTGVKITHTRKMLPAWRYLQQQAVLDGGGFLHRYNLGHSMMLKDNLLQSAGLPTAELAKLLRRGLSHTATLEIECDSLSQISVALEAGADIILLDNMTLDEIQKAIHLIDKRAIVEVSGGITLENIRPYAELGADVLSTSQITVGVPPIDLGLDFTVD
jgi:nicotinate-nucleotide pyrophosphorylase (carboxylating)